MTLIPTVTKKMVYKEICESIEHEIRYLYTHVNIYIYMYVCKIAHASM